MAAERDALKNDAAEARTTCASLAGERALKNDAADAQRLRTPVRITRGGPASAPRPKTRRRETAECHSRARTGEDGDGVADHLGRS